MTVASAELGLQCTTICTFTTEFGCFARLWSATPPCTTNWIPSVHLSKTFNCSGLITLPDVNLIIIFIFFQSSYSNCNWVKRVNPSVVVTQHFLYAPLRAIFESKLQLYWNIKHPPRHTHTHSSFPLQHLLIYNMVFTFITATFLNMVYLYNL